VPFPQVDLAYFFLEFSMWKEPKSPSLFPPIFADFISFKGLFWSVVSAFFHTQNGPKMYPKHHEAHPAGHTTGRIHVFILDSTVGSADFSKKTCFKFLV